MKARKHAIGITQRKPNEKVADIFHQEKGWRRGYEMVGVGKMLCWLTFLIFKTFFQER